MMDKQYKNILVNSLVNLGDVVLTTSAIALLKQAYPQARITMLVRPVVREAVENNPVIDEVMIFDYKPKENSLGKMWAMAKEIKARHFDLSISFDRKSRPAILCWLAGVPTRVGADRIFDDKPSKITWLYTHTVHIKHDLVNTLQAETYQEIVRQFTGIEGHEVPVMARIPSSSKEKADKLLSQLPTVGAPNDKEYADEVISICDEELRKSGISEKKEIINFCGSTNLLDLAALFYQTDLFVTVDTGATHIAATTGVKMVTMYGCTSPKRWHPYNENARVLSYDPECCPCSYGEHDCPHNPKPICLWEITPEMVLEKCYELVE